MDFVGLIQVLAPAIAVYVAIRVDQATMKIRLDHLERDFYKQKNRAEN